VRIIHRGHGRHARTVSISTCALFIEDTDATLGPCQYQRAHYSLRTRTPRSDRVNTRMHREDPAVRSRPRRSPKRDASLACILLACIPFVREVGLLGGLNKVLANICLAFVLYSYSRKSPCCGSQVGGGLARCCHRPIMQRMSSHYAAYVVPLCSVASKCTVVPKLTSRSNSYNIACPANN
jgi:hypothetical protein